MQGFLRNKWLSPLILIGACLLSGSATAVAQLQAGRIVGQVNDPQHAVISGATVTVVNSGTNISQTVTTGGSGQYAFATLDPGTYTVTAEAAGFETSVRKAIELSVGGSVEVDFGMVVGKMSTQVVVSSSGPTLNTESGALAFTVGNQQIVDLPLNGRQFTLLAELSPGVSSLPATGNTQNVRPEELNGNVFDGINGQETDFLLDGADITEHHEGGTYIATSIDALQEFNVEESPYTSEFPGVGAAFNSTTKSGTNQFHGDLFEFLRNDIFDARNYFALVRNTLKRDQFGGTIGGPVSFGKLYNGKDRTFFFGSYEGERQLQGNVTNTTVPTTAQLGGNFTAAGLHTIYDPLTTANGTRTQFDYDGTPNYIPPTRISSVATFFDKYLPAPNSANGLTYIDNPISNYRSDKVMLRVDQVINGNNKLFGRYSTDRNRETDYAVLPLLGSSYLQGPATNFEIALNSTFKTSIVNDVLFSHLQGQYRSTAYFQGQGAAMDLAAGMDPTTLAGLQNPATSTFPIFTISNYLGSTFTGQVNDGRPKEQNRALYELADNMTWVKGRQILKFGTRISRRAAELIDSRTSDGSFSFNGVMTQNPASSAGTGDAFADWLLGYPSSASRGNYATYWGGIGTYWHFYGQDDWKITDRLTVNLGLRYEYSPWLTPYKGQGAGFDPTQSKPIIVSSSTDTINLNAQPDAPTGYALYQNFIQTTSQAGLPLTVTNKDRLQFAPRVGFAWRPIGDKTVIRGGYGQFYQIESTNVRLNFNFLPFALVESLTSTTNVVPTGTTADYYQGAAFGAGLNPATSPVSWSPLPSRAQMAVNPHWSFGVQRQLPWAAVLSVDYVGTGGRHLPGTLNINDPTAGAGNVQARRPYQDFGTISYNTQNGASSYHSLQVKLQKHVTDGLWFLTSYTFSKSLTRQEVVAMGGNGFMNTGLSSFDVPQNLTVSVGYALPFGRGQRFASNAGRAVDAIIGGWQYQTISNFHSGLPFTPTVSKDVANIGASSEHPNITAGARCDHTSSLLNSFNISAYTVPAAYTYGDSGTDTCRASELFEVDMSLFKDFKITEGSKLQFRFEDFNVTNSAYFSTPSNTNIDSSAGGQITSTSNNPRQLQFALKLVF
jgi:hypothetical protein